MVSIVSLAVYTLLRLSLPLFVTSLFMQAMSVFLFIYLILYSVIYWALLTSWPA